MNNHTDEMSRKALEMSRSGGQRDRGTSSRAHKGKGTFVPLSNVPLEGDRDRTFVPLGHVPSPSPSGVLLRRGQTAAAPKGAGTWMHIAAWMLIEDAKAGLAVDPRKLANAKQLLGVA